MRFVARLHFELDDEAASLGPLRDLEALWASLDDVQLRGVAGAAIAQVHMISGRSAEAVDWAERALADAREAGDAVTEARALVERAGAMTGVLPRAESLAALDEALDAARRSGDAVLLTRAINNGLELVPGALRGGRRAAHRDAGRQQPGRVRQAGHGDDAAVGVRRRLRRRRPARRCAGSAPRARSGGTATGPSASG